MGRYGPVRGDQISPWVHYLAPLSKPAKGVARNEPAYIRHLACKDRHTVTLRDID